MKKIIIILLIIVSLLSFSPVVKGETATVDPVSIEQELKLQLIDLIKQMIVLLQQQILAIQQQTVAQKETLQIVQNNQPVATATVPVGEYSHFVSDISPNPVVYDGKTKSVFTMKLFDENGNAVSNTNVVFRQHRCKCNDQPIQTEYGYQWNIKSDGNGEIKFDIIVYKHMNNFLSVQVLDKPIKWIPIPTLFENQIWNWNENDGGYFTKVP